MILLVCIGIIYFFCSTCLGFLFSKKSSLFTHLLTGTAAITVYLNICSIFIRTDYGLLLPLFVVAVYVLWRSAYRHQLQIAILNYLRSSDNANLIVVLSFTLPLFLYLFVPPYNMDSSGYHYLAILWNEKYKVIPGLANLFPQFGYNSSFFTLSAAFSFTEIFHQSIYAINGILIFSFYLWMLKRSFQYSDSRKVLIWIFLVICLRYFPINLASPSADALASILVFYVLFRAFEEVEQPYNEKIWRTLLLLSCFAIIIKLSTLPIVFVAFIPLIRYSSNRPDILRMYARSILLASIIVVPWLIRNILLSGYFIFPYPAIDLFNPDWKVPVNVAIAEKLHISHAPRMVSGNWEYVERLSFFQWFPVWLKELWKDNHINLLLVIATLMSLPVAAVCWFRIQPAYRFKLLAWLTAFCGFAFWMFTSPDIRFGYHYMLPCIVLLLLLCGTQKSLAANIMIPLCLAVTGITIYYDCQALKKLGGHPLSDWIYRPLKDPHYQQQNDLSTFKYVMLNGKTKLYIHDRLHHSINAPLPSCSPYRTGLQMRGQRLEDGFRVKLP